METSCSNEESCCSVRWKRPDVWKRKACSSCSQGVSDPPDSTDAKGTSDIGEPLAQIMDVSIKVTIFHLCIHALDTAEEHLTADDKPEASKQYLKQLSFPPGEPEGAFGSA